MTSNDQRAGSVSASVRLPNLNLVSRSLGECLDAGLRLSARHASGLLSVSCAFALLGALMIRLTVDRADRDLPEVLLWVVCAARLMSPLVPLVVLPKVFGLQTRAVLSAAARQAVGAEIACACFDVTILVAAWTLSGLPRGYWLLPVPFVLGIWNLIRAFGPERRLLPHLDGTSAAHRPDEDRRLRRLVAGEFPTTVSQAAVVCAWWAVLTVVAFVTVDHAAGVLLGEPILYGRVYRPGSRLGNDELFTLVAELLRTDDAVLTLLQASLLVTFPLARLGWMLLYLDLRVTRDLYDLELRLHAEAESLRQGLRVPR